MTRAFLMTALAAVIVLSGLSAADDPPQDKPEPPVRLKKKIKQGDDPPPAPERRPEPRDEPEVPPDDGADPQEVLNRVAKNLRTIDERLANKEVNEGTRQLQRDALKDMDALIELMKRQQQAPNDASASSSPEQPQSEQQQQQQQRRQARAERRRQQQKSSNAMASRQQGNQPQQEQGRDGGQEPGRGGTSPEEMNKLADVYKDVWGHLPEALRGEMNAYSKERFMEKYNDLVRQYYSAIAEKSRRKGE